MTKTLFLLTLSAVAIPFNAFAIDGQVLINQSTVVAAGGFPYKITQPGSYKLSGNLTVTTDVDAIDITADHVTLDLNGFTISGNDPDSLVSGIRSTATSTTVINGTVTGFGLGVLLQGNGGHTVDGVKADSNSIGITVDPSGSHFPSVVVRSTANGNFSLGFEVLWTAISDCAASSSGEGTGIIASHSTVIRNNVTDNFLGLLLNNSVYGSNAITGNSNDISADSTSVSQKNNVCNAGAC